MRRIHSNSLLPVSVLNQAKITGLRKVGEKLIGRCPACAEEGGDRHAEHLVIYPDGRFGCVAHPGAAGREHRRGYTNWLGNALRDGPWW